MRGSGITPDPQTVDKAYITSNQNLQLAMGFYQCIFSTIPPT